MTPATSVCQVCGRQVPTRDGGRVGFHYRPVAGRADELAVCPGSDGGFTETLAYVRGFALADDDRRRERRVWVALLVACAVTAYSVGRYLVAPRALSCPPQAACRVVRCGGLAPVTPGNLTPDGGPVE